MAQQTNNHVENSSKEGASHNFITKQEILDDLKEALMEVKLYQEGKIKLQTAEELLDELS